MEYLIAFLGLVAAVSFAVFIAVNIEKGKSWAVEIAQAVSMLDPNSLDHPLRYREQDPAAEAASVDAGSEQPQAAGAADERLAA